MSLDVYLHQKEPITVKGSSGIFIRENGQTKEITEAEWNERYPDKEPIRSTHYEEETTEVFSANITHNLGKMADEAALYYPLWKPEKIGITTARQLIERLEHGLYMLQTKPEFYRQFNPANGWGTYEGLVQFVENYLEACRKFPESEVSVSR